MPRDRRAVPVLHSGIGRWALIALVVTSSHWRTAVAQTTQTQAASTFDPTTVPAPPAPQNPLEKSFSVGSAPSLDYWTVRNSQTGVVSVAGLATDPSANALVLKAKAGGKPFDAIFVSLTFKVDGLSKTYVIKTPIPVSGGLYAVPADDFNGVLDRFKADLNAALPSNFDPEKKLGYDESVKITVTPIESVTQAPPFAKDHTPKYTTDTPVDLHHKVPLKRILSPSETLQ